jgi:putative oxidoreductase
MKTQINDLTAAAGRLLLASLFLISGTGKLLAPAATKAYIASAGILMPDLAYLIALVVELGLATLLVAGYRTRLVAVLMAAFTLATALFFHAQFGDQNQMIHFLKNVAITGGLLQVAAYGAGSLSADAMLMRYRELTARL